ncbi:MAG: MBL fold metallo-hydrolase [Bacilli bacterium]|nr:MBL fold metallo-hydrolase [Bacilli bacterium]
MKVRVIGNGNITSNNFNASFLINDKILVDAPPGMLKELKKLNKNLDEIKVIVITHLHGDHYFDLPFIILNEYARGRKEKLIIVGPKELKKKLDILTKLAFNNRLNKYIANLNIFFLDANTVQNNQVDNDFYLSSIKLVHGEVKSNYGYIFKQGEKALGITGDTEMCPGLTYMLKKVDLILIDVNDKKGKHLDLNNFKDLVKTYQTNYIPVHFPDEIEEELLKLKNVKIIYPGEEFYI